MFDVKRIFGLLLNNLLSVLPKQNKIIFINFQGRGYGDSPKYIAEEIMHQLLPYDLVWLVYDMNETIPNRIRKVKFYSLKSRYELSTARVIISNTKGRLPYVKKKSQYYIQTWHGGFGVKYIEKDAEQFLPSKYVLDSKYDSSITDLILSGSEFQTKVIQESFWYDGEIFKKGVPRNDVFFRNTDTFVYQLKKKYGIDKGSKIVLYAPTFRDDDSVNAYQLNSTMLLQALKEKTGEDWKLIIRLHPKIANCKGLFNYDRNVLDGSGYADSQELLVLSDLLITDFSSMMMDFAIMKKPVLLFITDLEDYVNKCRGIRPLFYELPFILNRSNEDLCHAIGCFDSKEYLKSLEYFMNKHFHSYDDGNASMHVVDRIKEKMV